MRLTLFTSAKSISPLILDVSWQQFTKELGPHDFSKAEKWRLPAWCPAEFEHAKKRSDANVLQIHMFVLDVDGPNSKGVDEQVALDAISRATALGLACAFYTTWSRHLVAPKWKFRLVVPLSRPVFPSEWGRFWTAANDLFGDIGDPACKNPSRIYFGAFAPPGTEDTALLHIEEGGELDVDKLVGPAPADADKKKKTHTTECSDENSKILTREILEELTKKMRRKKSTFLADMGRRLRCVLDGEVYAEPGERDEITFKLAGVLVDNLPGYSASSMSRHFIASLQLMERQEKGAPTESDVEEKISRLQVTNADQRQQLQELEQEELSMRIREAFNSDRSTPYEPDEVGEIDRAHWVLQRDRAFYTRFETRYRGPYTIAEALPAIYRDLSPAVSLGVELHKLDKQNTIIQKTLSDLMRDYGTVLDNVIVDLRAQECVFDKRTRTIIEAPCPVRNIEPVYYPDINQWIELLVGDGGPGVLHNLKSWFAGLTRLDLRCVALVITGPKGVGKTLTALSVNRIFSTGQPSSLDEVFSNFNDVLLQSPICFADEYLPTDYRGNVQMAELRRHIQALQRELKRKFLPSSVLLGATRTIIASNNEDILSTTERISNDEVEASLERFLHITPTEAAAEYLRNTDTTGWVDEDKIAAHCLWLRDNYEWQPEGRFMIKVDVDKLRGEMLIRNHFVMLLFQWLVGFLKRPNRMELSNEHALMVRVYRGRLLVNAQGIIHNWSTYVPNERCPSVSQITNALSNVSAKQRVQMRVDFRIVNYREVALKSLISWAEYSGWMTEEAILDALQADTESHTLS